VWFMSERIWGALRKNALYKSNYTLLYFTGHLLQAEGISMHSTQPEKM